MHGFYCSLGMAILGTVMDGDCGIDVACQMLGLAQTADQRTCLREKISGYLIDRVREPWMHELMVSLQEVEAEDVEAYRSCGPGSIGGEASASADASQGAPKEAAEVEVEGVQYGIQHGPHREAGVGVDLCPSTP